ncbi:glutamyl-tRNA reductase [Vitreoscilla sp. C1]|uniref:glutamyl-tRNA reductase n=1 Tax=Vitreoscilla sp. (strain C1) TaxID=96942 RepID=UPI000CDC2F4E|nr:glutamyl-tRNA reductase [Vitreoscilla sp. C1]AUZ04496.1 glutamyl-tRNA reductase [Vitreoscilla sp. C1]
MQLTAIGLNHQTAPLSIRERLAFAAQSLPDAVKQIVQNRAAREAVILSTCNRTELYCVGKANDIVHWLADYHSLPENDIRPYLYTLDSDETIRHAFRVSCGLDSMVLGEPQILGQLKDAVRVAQEQASIDTTLNNLFQKTFSVAKEVRSNTAVGDSSVSMAAASVKMAEQIFPKIADLNVLFIGAGEMIELVATYFAAKSPKKITVANRTLERARQLCSQLGGNTDASLLTDLPNIIHQYDVVVSSTASPLPIVGKGMIECALKQRRRHPMFLLDLAVPRDIEAQVADINDAYLYTVDDMMQVVQMGKEARQEAAAEAESIIENRVNEFLLWQRSRQVIPTIKALREAADVQRQQALNTALKQLGKGVSAEEVLEKLSLQLTNKLLHAPTVALHQINQHPHLSEAVSEIYRLPEHL